jgi:hypothetical protein
MECNKSSGTYLIHLTTKGCNGTAQDSRRDDIAVAGAAGPLAVLAGGFADFAGGVLREDADGIFVVYGGNCAACLQVLDRVLIDEGEWDRGRGTGDGGFGTNGNGSLGLRRNSWRRRAGTGLFVRLVD